MIVFNNEIEFELDNPEVITTWISQSIENEGFEEGEINYIFCSDEYLLEKNVKFLKHNTLTDIISFDYSMGKLVSGDIFISIDRVIDNAKTFDVSFNDELNRVMIHGILHYCGYKDKTDDEKMLMCSKEDYYLSLRKF
ncbi:rRNA maturation RNase YbeY [Urechidicola croceus]|uniref:Endoribonuclease YbeY n=1 Tax=Urechidicola croceus TaxID=1850246 RepID=A0A1D8P975_9FLAO|nr:rRNA maturation RNase YbeY [Urechidicola croceus]AOW21117.1 rRNA maturation RNase YbeY [Urechidicola croceus]